MNLYVYSVTAAKGLKIDVARGAVFATSHAEAVGLVHKAVEAEEWVQTADKVRVTVEEKPVDRELIKEQLGLAEKTP